MTAPYYSDELVTLHLGDCLEVLAAREESSVDAVVTDPPYGLEFMGREWDTFKGEAWRTGAGMTKPGIGPRPTEWPSFGGSDTANPTCATCGGRKRGAWKCACADPEWRVKGKPLEQRDNNAAQMRAYQEWCEAWASECFRVLKPGGHLLAFGGTRIYHRLACAIEDAGFEVRDSLHWIYGSGFPKSLDVSKAIDKAAGAEREVIGEGDRFGRGSMRNRSRVEMGYRPTEINPDGGAAQITDPATEDAARWEGWGTALKPAHEPIVVARKPLAGTVARNVLQHGTGALNVDGCRVGVQPEREGSNFIRAGKEFPSNTGSRANRIFGEDNSERGGYYDPAGRWPPNILLTHSAECNGDCAPDCPVAELDRQSGIGKSPQSYTRNANGGVNKGIYSAAVTEPAGTVSLNYGDTGGASRFFPALNWDPERDAPFLYCAKAPKKERPSAEGVGSHPTVKPLALMRRLVRLVTPPGGLVLDPFAGTGTTGQACALEGFRCCLIEKDPGSAELARVRLSRPVQQQMTLDCA